MTTTPSAPITRMISINPYHSLDSFSSIPFLPFPTLGMPHPKNCAFFYKIILHFHRKRKGFSILFKSFLQICTDNTNRLPKTHWKPAIRLSAHGHGPLSRHLRTGTQSIFIYKCPCGHWPKEQEMAELIGMISIHSAPTGTDCASLLYANGVRIFQSTVPLWALTRKAPTTYTGRWFQSTVPLRALTAKVAKQHTCVWYNFHKKFAYLPIFIFIIP